MGPSSPSNLLHRHRAEKQAGQEGFGMAGLRMARSRTTRTQGRRSVHGIVADFQQHAFYFACGAFNAYTRGANAYLPGHGLV